MVCLGLAMVTAAPADESAARKLEVLYGREIGPELYKAVTATQDEARPPEVVIHLWIDDQGVPKKVETRDGEKKPVRLPKLTAALMAARFPRPPESLKMPVVTRWLTPNSTLPDLAGESRTRWEIERVIALVGQANVPDDFLLRLWIDGKGKATKVEIRDAADKPISSPELVKELKKATFDKYPPGVTMPVSVRWRKLDISQVIAQRVHETVSTLPPDSLPYVFIVKIWIDANGVPSKVETQDVFANPISNPVLTAALLKARFDMPPAPVAIPMPVHIKIKVDKDRLKKPPQGT